MKNPLPVFTLFLISLFTIDTPAYSQSPDPPLNQSMRTFEIQGHRGCRGLMPENTIPAFIEALRIGVRTLEMDVVVTSDSHLLVSHEPWLSPEICTGDNGRDISSEMEGKKYNLFKLTLEEIRKFDCGLKLNPRFPLQKKMNVCKPSLVEVIDQCASYTEWDKSDPVFYNIELKSRPEWDGIYHPAPEVFAVLLLQVLHDKGIIRQTMIQSFDYRILKAMKQLEPSVRISALAEQPVSIKQVVDSLGFMPDVFSPYHIWINADMISEWHRNGVKVIPWTINEEEQMRKVYNFEADGIITDYPDLALRLFRMK